MEDDDDLRFATRLTLEAAGWTVAEAGTAADGLRAMRTVDPDVVLLDLGLPDADGVSVLAEMKSTEATSWVPVIVLSRRSDPSEVSRMLLLGAQDYLVKPYSTSELHARIVTARRVALEHRRLDASERRRRLAFDSAPLGMAEVDLDARFVTVNPALCDLVERPSEALIGAPVASVCDPESGAELAAWVSAIGAGEVAARQAEWQLIHADGHPVRVGVSGVPLAGDDGLVEHLLLHIRDIAPPAGA